MSGPRFLIAKYIADLKRGEPRNIGVIVWTPGEVVCKFIGQSDDLPGKVDGRSVPDFVNSVTAYKQWVKYWNKSATCGVFAPPDGKPGVERSDERFLNAIAATSKGNFVLVEAGFGLDEMQGDDLRSFAGYLFETLVASHAPEEPRDLTLEELCDELFEESTLNADPNFYSKGFPVECPIPSGPVDRLEFSHAYKNGTLHRLYQRMPIPKKKSSRLLWKSVHETAWKFEKVQGANIITQNQGAVLVFVSEEQEREEDVKRSIGVLNSVSRVINLRRKDDALQEFSTVAKLGQRHDMLV